MMARFGSGVWLRASCLCLIGMVGLQAMAADDGDAERRSALQREQVRIAKIRAWARKKGASPAQLLQMVYEPIAKGNEKQYPKMQRLASRYYERAQEAEKKREPKKAKQYYTLSALFKAYAKQNKEVVDSYKKGDTAAAKKACDQILKIERKVFELTGVRVDRDWFTPDEVLAAPAAAAGAAAGEGGRGGRSER